MIINSTAGVSIAALATLLSACAANVRPDMSSFLVKQGEPSVSYDVADSGKHEPAKGASPIAQETSPRDRTDAANTVEFTDKVLARALGTLQRADTVQNRLRAAAEYRRLRILDKAYDHVTMALKLDHRSAEAFEQRAQIWREWGFASLGLTDAYRAVFISPRSASARNTLGTILQSIGDVKAARLAYQRVLELDPGAAYAWSNLCYLSLLTDNADRAVTECGTALRLGPDVTATRNNFALSYAAAGRLQEAREELLTNGSPADAAFNIGMLYLAVGQYQLAEESFSAAIDIRPNFSAAQTRRRQAAGRTIAPSNTYEYSNRP